MNIKDFFKTSNAVEFGVQNAMEKVQRNAPNCDDCHIRRQADTSIRSLENALSIAEARNRELSNKLEDLETQLASLAAPSSAIDEFIDELLSKRFDDDLECFHHKRCPGWSTRQGSAA